MAKVRAAAATQMDAPHQWNAHFIQVNADLRQHLLALSDLLARQDDPAALSPEVQSELALVKSLIEIYTARSAEDLEDFKTGFSDLGLT
jgi:hypothetical protein